jgi:hypothetical protein
MKKGIIFIFAAALPLIFFSAFSAERPSELPQGFEWIRLPYVNAYVAKPSEWFFHHIDKPKEKRYAFILSKENIQAGIALKTGLNIVVIEDVPGKKNMSPSKYAGEIIENCKKTAKISREWQKKKDMFNEFGFIRTDSSADGGTQEYFVILSNDATGSIYFFSFLAPLDQWSDFWKKAEIILNNIHLDEKI